METKRQCNGNGVRDRERLLQRRSISLRQGFRGRPREGGKEGKAAAAATDYDGGGVGALSERKAMAAAATASEGWNTKAREDGGSMKGRERTEGRGVGSGG